MNYEKEYKKLKADIEKAYLFAQTDSTKATLEHILPELKESEDERTRKELISFLQLPHPQFVGERKQEKWVAWLEKQGSNLVKNGYTNNKDVIEYAGNYSREIWHKLMDNFKNIKDYHIGCNDVSDIVLNAIINTYNWLEKQGGKKETLCDKCRKEHPSHSCQDITALGRCAIENKEEPQVYEIEDDKVITYSETDGYKVIEPKFKVGDKIKFSKEPKYLAREVINIKNGAYYFDELVYLPFSYQDEWELVEQKSADKIESKFKVGDWIVTDNNHTWLIDEDCSTTGYSYRLISQNGKVEVGDYNIVDEHSHLWTIKDAKPGDVLAMELNGYSHPFVAIFKEQNGEYFNSHCFVGFNGEFYEGQNGHVNENVHPATKEQCDLLFRKMMKSGYEWDDENKELKHILE